ncbi:hypothetical protein CRENBAI_000963 [Crenichthys baileyi]|uniref:Uncharacterized protein n=1 Tax=Crenichthys baileyi TaxID=28760 RepID=A0AAV9QV46_9TELE
MWIAGGKIFVSPELSGQSKFPISSGVGEIGCPGKERATLTANGKCPCHSNNADRETQPHIPTHSMPDKNASLCTHKPNPLFEVPSPAPSSPGPSFPLPLACRTVSSVSPRSSPPPAAAPRATDAFIVLLFLALALQHPAASHLPPAQDRRAAEAFIHPSPLPFRASHPPCPGTLSLRNGRLQQKAAASLGHTGPLL